MREVREEAEKAMLNLNFRTTLPPLCLLARHAYALTFERKYVEEWEAEVQAEMKANPAAHVAGDEDDGFLADLSELRKK